MHKVTKKTLIIILYFFFVLFLIEFFSYWGIKTLSNKAVFYNQTQVKQSYEDYIKVRDPLLGWKNKNPDYYGARIDKSNFSKSKTSKILGCTVKEFIQHLQNQFKPGMTLENHGQGPGKWNIDHIVPISSARTEEEIYKLNHYTNFQPLWWEENMAKGKKI